MSASLIGRLGSSAFRLSTNSIIRDNIRQLVEQAAAFSGAEDEARNADRIAQQTEELEKLVKQRDALLKK
jgi:hypothetical protein